MSVIGLIGRFLSNVRRSTGCKVALPIRTYARPRYQSIIRQRFCRVTLVSVELAIEPMSGGHEECIVLSNEALERLRNAVRPATCLLQNEGAIYGKFIH
jgi:hypothetical protein